MKKTILTLFIGCMGSISFAQESADLSTIGCGTITTPEEMQRLYDFNLKQLPSATFKTTAVVDTIPLSLHIVGKDDGSGYYSLDNLFSVICELNVRYAPVNMFFYIQWPINYINNTSYYEHNNYIAGAQMMQGNNIANTVNVYFVEDPNGACGYFSPGPDGIAIAKKCSAPASTTLVHEIGHYFGLAHTFYGWENGNTPSSSDQERVVRTGSGANCNRTGDGFCDTEADYLGDRWNCPYNGTKLDLDNNAYRPDASVYMSYSTDACMSRFTTQQIAYMQNTLHTRRSNLLSRVVNKPAPYTVMAQPNIVYPENLLYSNYQKVIWKKVEGAEYYHVKILRNGIIPLQEALTADTLLLLNFNAFANYTFSVKIDPLMGSNVCKVKSNTNTHSFTSTDAVTTMGVGNTSSENSSVKIVPNPVTGSMVEVQMQSLPSGAYQIQLMNMSGQKVLNYTMNHNESVSHTQISTSNLPAGMYFIQVKGTDGSQWTEKLLIQR